MQANAENGDDSLLMRYFEDFRIGDSRTASDYEMREEEMGLGQ